MPRPSAPATLMDLARETGFSHMTVQRALAGSPVVRPETREAILAAANRLGYRPNASARAMRNGRSDRIGLVVSDQWQRGEVTPALIDGIEDVLASRGMHLQLARLPDADLTSEDAMPRFLREAMLDGLLFKYENRIPGGLTGLIERFRIPCVWINVRLRHDCVHPDDLASGREAAERLIALGHRRILYADFSYDPDDRDEHYSAHDRFAGYGAAMAAAGLPVLAVRGRHFPADERYEQARAALATHRPTAVIGYANSATWPFQLLCRDRGLRVPSDLSLCSLDGGNPEGIGMPLTHLRLDQRALGAAACTRLLERLERPAKPLPPQTVPPVFIDQGTCAAPA